MPLMPRIRDLCYPAALVLHVERLGLRRLRHAHSIGCHSMDGTFLAYGPDGNLPTLLGCLRTIAPETAGAPDLHHVQ